MTRITEIKEGDLHIRAGIVITDGKSVLGCLPTPTKRWLNTERLFDLPKGHMEPGETPVQSAVRECWEETGIAISEKCLRYHGEFEVYGEPFHLFSALVNKFPELTDLYCPSTFERGCTTSKEVAAYKYIPIMQAETSFQKDLVPIVIKALVGIQTF